MHLRHESMTAIDGFFSFTFVAVDRLYQPAFCRFERRRSDGGFVCNVVLRRACCLCATPIASLSASRCATLAASFLHSRLIHGRDALQQRLRARLSQPRSVNPFCVSVNMIDALQFRFRRNGMEPIFAILTSFVNFVILESLSMWMDLTSLSKFNKFVYI